MKRNVDMEILKDYNVVVCCCKYFLKLKEKEEFVFFFVNYVEVEDICEIV